MVSQLWTLLQQVVVGGSTTWQVALALLPAWLLGTLTGYFWIPRPEGSPSTMKGRGGQAPSPWVLFFSGPGLRRFALLYHLGLIVREFWVAYTEPGTFRAFTRAAFRWMCGKGFDFQPPALASLANLRAQYDAAGQTGSPASPAMQHPMPQQRKTEGEGGKDDWYVTQEDVNFFKHVAEQDGDVPGASAWEVMMDKDIPHQIKYTSWRRTLANGKTEYKSLTYSPDATMQEFMDVYFDDDYRPTWDTMIVHHEVVEQGDFDQRQQVVRWIRRFPFKFLSDREYFIARRLFVESDAMYGITKVVPDHPAVKHYSGPNNSTTKMDVFYSMWRSRTVPCPWGSGRPACATLLLHHEQFKIPEHLARFAVRHGMWGFIKCLSERVPEFIAARRKRGVDPFQMDPMAFGANMLPSTPTPCGSNCSPASSPSPFANAATNGAGSLSRSGSASPGLSLSRAGSLQQQQQGGAGGEAGGSGGKGAFHLSGSCLSLASMDSGNNGPTNGGYGARGAYMRQSTNGALQLQHASSMGSAGGLLGPMPSGAPYVLQHAASAGNLSYKVQGGLGSYGSGLSAADGPAGRRSNNGGLQRKVRGLLAMALAGGMAVAFKRSPSMPNLPGGSGGGSAAAAAGAGHGQGQQRMVDGHKAMKQRHHRQRRQQAGGSSNGGSLL